MPIFTFCPTCEERTGVEFQVLKLETSLELKMVSCPRCDKVLNTDRWVKLTVQSFPEQKNRFLNKICDLLPLVPNWVLILLNKVTQVFGFYFAPDPSSLEDVPEIVDSLVVQLEEMSGLPPADEETFESYMRRSLRTVKQRELALSAG